MGRTIAVANQKGGVGKTTCTMNLGAAIAAQGHQVLLVDADPQRSLTAWLSCSSEECKACRGDAYTARAMIGGVHPNGTPIRRTHVAGLDLVPGDSSLAGVEFELAGQPDCHARFARAMEGLPPRYEFILIDCPPALSVITLNALMAADEVLVPVPTETAPLEGLVQILQFVVYVRQKFNPRLRLTGVVASIHDRRLSLSTQVLEELRRRLGERLLKTVIRRNVRLTELPGHHRPINEYDPGSSGTQDFAELAAEILAIGAPVEEVCHAASR